MYSNLKRKVQDIVDKYVDGNSDTTLLKGFIAELSPIIEEYEQKMAWSVEWSPDDMIGQAAQARKPWIMSRELAIEALDDMISHHDASIGINWDMVDYYVDKYTPVEENE